MKTGDKMMRICVIGAGCSGIVTMKALQDEGFTRVTCLEASSDIAGVWTQRAYDCLTLNSSRLMAQLADFPWPFETSDFPSHSEFVRYYRAYVEQHNLSSKIQLNSRVTQVVERGGTWRVSLQTGPSLQFDSVVVCTGPFSVPNIPESMEHLGPHAMHYQNPRRYAGRNVALVGIGNTALDIALDLAEGGAASVTIVSSSGALLIPFFNEGRQEPADYFIHSHLFVSKTGQVKAKLLREQCSTLLKLCIEKGGMPNPTLKTRKPRLSMVKNWKRFAACVESGKISFSGDTNNLESYDDVILCTGYRIDIPFLEAKYKPYLGGEFFDRGHSGYDTDYLGLYKSIMYPGDPATLFYVGFLDTLANLPTLAQVQGRWVAGVLAGRVSVPPAHERWEAVKKTAEKDKRRNDKVPLLRSWPREPMHLLEDLGETRVASRVAEWPEELPVVPALFRHGLTAAQALTLAAGLRVLRGKL